VSKLAAVRLVLAPTVDVVDDGGRTSGVRTTR
jgi:hypothetical protein